MSDTFGFPHDHAEIAWGHWLAQHIGKANTEAFVRAFYPPINILDQALSDLLNDRWLETAVGQQLDGIGSIVGQARIIQNSIYVLFFGFKSQISGRGFGVARLRRKREPWTTSSILGDTDYRTLLYLKIALNNGHGTTEELMHAFNSALKVTYTRVVDWGNANARVFINDFIMSYDPRSQLLNYMIPKAAGVKLWIYYYSHDHTFGFINQNMGYEGFNIGILARRAESNQPPMTGKGSVWDQGFSIWDRGESEPWDAEVYFVYKEAA